MTHDVDIRVIVLVDDTHFDLLQAPGVDLLQLAGEPPYLLPECSAACRSCKRSTCSTAPGTGSRR